MPVYIQNDDNLIETLGSRIKFFREYAGMSQGDFADSLMVTQKAVSKWETGKCLPQIDKITDIALVLNVSVNDLLFDPFKADNYSLSYDCTKEYLHSMRLLKAKVGEDDVYRFAYDFAKYKFKRNGGKFVYKRNLTPSEALECRSWKHHFHRNVFDYFDKVDLSNIRYMTCMKGELTMAMMRVFGFDSPIFKDGNNPYYRFSDSIVHKSLVVQ